MKRTTDRTSMTEPVESLMISAASHDSPKRPIGEGAVNTARLHTSRMVPKESLRKKLTALKVSSARGDVNTSPVDLPYGVRRV